MSQSLHIVYNLDYFIEVLFIRKYLLPTALTFLLILIILFYNCFIHFLK